MIDVLVKDSELAEYLKLPVTDCQLTLFLNDCGLMSVQYFDVPNGNEEAFAVHPDYESCNLGHLLLRMRDKDGDLTPEWCWNSRGCRVVLALFQKLKPRHCHEVTKEVVRDTLASIAGSAPNEVIPKRKITGGKLI